MVSRKLLNKHLLLIFIVIALVISRFFLEDQISPPSRESTVTPTPIVVDDEGKRAELFRVIHISDGDTFRISTGETVRLIGLNAPEIGDNLECFGNEATEALRKLLLNKEIRMEKDVSETDRYGRLLRYVWLEDELANVRLVQDGYAYARDYHPDVKYTKLLHAAEVEAKNTQRGLWSVCSTITATPKPEVKGATAPNPECSIKGNIGVTGEHIYHTEGCQDYGKVTINELIGERWFCNEEEATVSGWRKAKNC